MHSLFLQEPDQAVTETRGHQIRQEVEIPEDTLGQDHASPDEYTRFLELDKHKQVRAFILSLL